MVNALSHGPIEGSGQTESRSRLFVLSMCAAFAYALEGCGHSPSAGGTVKPENSDRITAPTPKEPDQHRDSLDNLDEQIRIRAEILGENADELRERAGRLYGVTSDESGALILTFFGKYITLPNFEKLCVDLMIESVRDQNAETVGLQIKYGTKWESHMSPKPKRPFLTKPWYQN